MLNSIQIRGARVHNLKNIDVDIPRNKFVVITGVSGSGKSSLAFDTLYAEGQRRFVESLSAYARQFLERMERPDVDEIRGICPAVAIQQKNPTRNSRSTVATATEIHDYLRLLFARVGRTFCPGCGQEVKRDDVDAIVARLMALHAGTKIQLAFPLRGKTKDAKALELADLKQRGFFRLLIDDELVLFDDLKPARLKEQIFVLVDRLKVAAGQKTRLADSVDLALREGGGHLSVLVEDAPPLRFSQALHCARCDLDFIEPQPRLFSFNNPFGACQKCSGFGEVIELDMERVIPDASRSLLQGAVTPWNTPRRQALFAQMLDTARKHGIDIHLPWRDLNDEQKQVIIDGERPFPGIRGFFRKLERKKYKIGVRVLLSRYRGFVPCPDCNLNRLRPEALNVRVGDKHIGEVNRLSIQAAHDFFEHLALSAFEQEVASQILQELRRRLNYLVDVGLGYLTLDRRTQTLSGGEYQRINLATALGFKLVGSLYVLDEPSIGLHPRDNERLIKILLKLRDLGNTVVVVEHDRDMMRTADYLVDLGPAAGELGGNLVYAGGYEAMVGNGVDTLTAAYLKGRKHVAVPAQPRTGNGHFVTVYGARENNLRNLTVRFPLGLLCVVTGVSGSGKSTLVHDVLYAGIKKSNGERQERAGRCDRIEGLENIDGVVLVDQSPIGRTPRSNPLTYTKAFDGVRELFAQTRRAEARGFSAGTFSFNTSGGRCEQCEGAGMEKVEMQFLSDLYLKCEACGGRRYTPDVLDVRYKGKNIFEVLEMTVTASMAFFADAPKVLKKLRALQQVGLGYLRLGQSATTLSGGEAQRVKLAAHLADRSGRRLLYIFDEPTTGLHFDDIARLLDCFYHLLEKGHSLLVIEHNLDVIKCADHIIDLGPEGGDAGGDLVAEGLPEAICENARSLTGSFLRDVLTESS